MKMIDEHLRELKRLITPLDTEERRRDYRKGNYPRAELTKDLNRRYRWDLFWSANAYDLIKDGGYEDSHIYTALKSFIPNL